MWRITNRFHAANWMMAFGLGIFGVGGAAVAGPVTLETGDLEGEIRYNRVTGELVGSGAMFANLGAADVDGFDMGQDVVAWVLGGSGGPDGEFTMDVAGIGGGPQEIYELQFDGVYSIPAEYRTSFGVFGTCIIIDIFAELLDLGITHLGLEFNGFSYTGLDGDWAVFEAQTTQSSFGLFGTPTPGTLSLLAMGALVAGRRRR